MSFPARLQSLRDDFLKAQAEMTGTLIELALEPHDPVERRALRYWKQQVQIYTDILTREGFPPMEDWISGSEGGAS